MAIRAPCHARPGTARTSGGWVSVGGMEIREMVESDWPQVWPIVEEVTAARETFPFDPAGPRRWLTRCGWSPRRA